MPERASGRWSRWLLVSLAILVADLVTKAWIIRDFPLGERVVVTPFFNLVHVHNTGAAFSFLAGAQGWQTLLFATIAGFAVWGEQPNALGWCGIALVIASGSYVLRASRRARAAPVAPD